VTFVLFVVEPNRENPCQSVAEIFVNFVVEILATASLRPAFLPS
jgi:hypothetical protein